MGTQIMTAISLSVMALRERASVVAISSPEHSGPSDEEFLLILLLIVVAIAVIVFIIHMVRKGSSPRNGVPTAGRPSSAPRRQASETVYCTHCGKPIAASSRFCPKCGNQR